ncbi:MAG: hypothetical protein HDT30_10995 [Clostridiales bacterium]|nr:hypothetical protein [Clostridiales bacterium]
MKVKIEKNKKRNIISEMFSLLAKEMGKLYIVQFIYMGVFFLLLSPFFSAIITNLLQMEGYRYLTQELMPIFFRKPLVIAAIILMFFMVCVCIQYIMLYSFEFIKRSYTNEKISAIMLLFTTGQKYILLLKQSYGRIFLTWIGIALFYNIPVIYLTGKFLPVPKVIIKALSKYPYVSTSFSLLVVLLCIHGFLRFFRLSYILFEGKKEKESRKLSIKLYMKNIWKTMAMWMGNNLLVVGIAILFYLISVLVTIGLLVLFVPNTLKIAVFCTIQEHIYNMILVVVLVLGMNLQITGSVILFYHCSPSQKVYEEEIPQNAFGIKKRILGGALILILGVDLIVTYDTIRNGGSVSLQHFGQICITSHRGDSAAAPENTLPAIESALKSTADYIEIDVQETKDGEVVLMHDDNLLRTTGFYGKVSDMTYKELKNLDAGGWFSKEYTNTKIPTLKEVLKLCKGKKKLNIEIKTGVNMPELEKKVVTLIEKYDFVRQCVVTSVYKESLNKVKELNEDIVTGYILSSAYGRYYLDEEIDFLSMRDSFVNERVIRLAHKYGKEVHVWTVNSERDVIRLSQLGVDNIITDKPDYVRQELYENTGNKIIIELLRVFL